MMPATAEKRSLLRKSSTWAAMGAAMVWLALSTIEPASAARGQLQVAAATAQLSSATPSTSVTVTNSGDAAATSVSIKADAPDWVEVTLTLPGKKSTDPTTQLGTLKPGETVLLTLTATIPAGGRAGTITLEASGMSNARLAAVATVTLPDSTPPIGIETAGADEIGDHSAGVVTITVRNDTPQTLKLRLDATGDGLNFPDTQPGGWIFPWTKPTPKTSWTKELSIDANQAIPVAVTVGAQTPVQPRQTALVVTAAVPEAGGPPSTIVSTHEVNLSITADGLVPTITGISSALALPGLGALLAFLWEREKDRAKLNIPPRSVATTVWENKLWLLVALAISLITITLVDWITGVDLIATPWTWVLLVATAAATVIGWLTSFAMVKVHRHYVPPINSDSDFRAVLQAAGKTSCDRRRQVYEAGTDQRGMIIHRDYDYIILAPKIWFSGPGDLTPDNTSLSKFVDAGQSVVGDFDSRASGWVPRPTPVPATSVKTGAMEDLLHYDDTRA